MSKRTQWDSAKGEKFFTGGSDLLDDAASDVGDERDDSMLEDDASDEDVGLLIRDLCSSSNLTGQTQAILATFLLTGILQNGKISSAEEHHNESWQEKEKKNVLETKSSVKESTSEACLLSLPGMELMMIPTGLYTALESIAVQMNSLKNQTMQLIMQMQPQLLTEHFGMKQILQQEDGPVSITETTCLNSNLTEGKFGQSSKKDLLFTKKDRL